MASSESVPAGFPRDVGRGVAGETTSDRLEMEHYMPRPAGTPVSPWEQRLNPRTRLLVEWVANASAGDRIPEPWRWARNPTRSVILTLVDLGLMANPPMGSDLTAVVQEASAAARAWLKEHPLPGEGAEGQEQ